MINRFSISVSFTCADCDCSVLVSSILQRLMTWCSEVLIPALSQTTTESRSERKAELTITLRPCLDLLHMKSSALQFSSAKVVAFWNSVIFVSS